MLYFKHRGTEIQSFVFLKFNEDTEFFYKTQRYKGTKFFFRYKYNKQLKSCHEALRTINILNTEAQRYRVLFF